MPGAKPASGSPQRGIRLKSEPIATNTSAAASTSNNAGTAQRNTGGASRRSIQTLLPLLARRAGATDLDALTAGMIDDGPVVTWDDVARL